MNTNKYIYSIIFIQRIFRKRKQELNILSTEIVFIKECLIDMSFNLNNINKLKIFDGYNYGYISILAELKLIKEKIELLPDSITFSLLKYKKISEILKEIIEIKSDIIKYINHISMSNFFLLMRLILGPQWINFLNNNDLSKLELITRLFNPINVWDSDYHKTPINYIEVKKRQQYNKDIINNMADESSKSSSIIIGDINAFPLFIKSLSEMVAKEKLKKINRITHFNYIDLVKYFKNENIIFIKNEQTNSLIEEKNGFIVMIKIKNRIIVIQGIAKDDSLNIFMTNNYAEQKFYNIQKYIQYEIITVPKIFRLNYIDILNIRDIIIFTPEDIGSLIKQRYNDYKNLKTKQLKQLIDEFLLASKIRKFEMLIILLCGNEYDSKLGYLLYDILRMKDKRDIYIEILNALPISLRTRLEETENIVNEDEINISKNIINELSYERKINMLNLPQSIKDKVIDKLKTVKSSMNNDNKAQSWLDGFFKIPFGVYKENKIMKFKKNFLEKNNISFKSCTSINKYLIDNKIDTNEWDTYNKNKTIYLKHVHDSLENAVYGHKDAKLQIERLFAQWINGETKGAVIGLWGPPGTGKTSLVKNGLSKCLVDDNNKNRPFAFLPIGGSVNGSTLVGHNYTYVGASWGRIVDILITSECMNPIIFIDEIDKISNTEYGREIIAVLTHLTDSTQNDSFEDKYFSGIPLDLSKALIVFSFNDISLLDPILKDCITIVETKPYTLPEKIHIINNYMLPEILNDVGYDANDIIFSTELIKYIIDTYTNEAGVRKIKEKLVEIIRDINLNSFNTNINFPFIITKEYIDTLFINKYKIKINKIHNNPEIGLVNGLYATTTGIGGLTVIQVMKYPSDKMLELTITGQQGEVMKESVEYALRIAYNLLDDKEKEQILEDSRNKKSFGLLIHTPDAGTKKDGPSAGCAMTLAIYSLLSNKPVNNTVAMTGEIDLCKNVKPIGGVYAKLTGAKMAGVKLALIPKDNLEDLTILRNNNISPEDDNFKVTLIEHFDDVIKYSLL